MEIVEKNIFLKELNHYLQADPSLGQFNRKQRSRIVLRWVQMGEYEGPASFMDAYSSSVDMAWYLQSYIYQNEARFEEALNLLRSGLTSPNLPSEEVEPSKIASLQREFLSKPRNYKIGLQSYLVFPLLMKLMKTLCF